MSEEGRDLTMCALNIRKSPLNAYLVLFLFIYTQQQQKSASGGREADEEAQRNARQRVSVSVEELAPQSAKHLLLLLNTIEQ